MKNQSLNLFQRRDEMDELEGFQQQELSKVKHMVRIFVSVAKCLDRLFIILIFLVITL